MVSMGSMAQANNSRMIFRSVVIIAAFGCMNVSDLGAQHFEKDHKRHSMGLMISQGGQALLDVQYRYLVTLLQAEYQFSVLRKGSWQFHLMAQPHYGITRFNFDNADPVNASGYELGMNLGLQLERVIRGTNAAIYMGAGTGPHYLSEATHRQSEGLIFSSNLFMGITYRFSAMYELDLRTAFRHISNAGLQLPNGGINNSMVGVGLFRRL